MGEFMFRKFVFCLSVGVLLMQGQSFCRPGQGELEMQERSGLTSSQSSESETPSFPRKTLDAIIQNPLIMFSTGLVLGAGIAGSCWAIYALSGEDTLTPGLETTTHGSTITQLLETTTHGNTITQLLENTMSLIVNNTNNNGTTPLSLTTNECPEKLEKLTEAFNTARQNWEELNGMQSQQIDQYQTCWNQTLSAFRNFYTTAYDTLDYSLRTPFFNLFHQFHHNVSQCETKN